MGNYTTQRENDLFSVWQWNDVNDYTQVRNVLGMNFRTFGEGLTDIMQAKLGENGKITDSLQYLTTHANKNGVPISAIASMNTLKSWFSGGPRPKKSDTSRYSIFAIAFALELTTDETAQLFHKVYLDRAFNFRDQIDITAYYCLSHGYSWTTFESMLQKFPSNDENEHTVYTGQLGDMVALLDSDEAFYHFIKTHQHNLSRRNLTARNQLDRLLAKANSFAQKEVANLGTQEQFEGSDRSSRSFTYEVITGLSPSGKNGTVSVFKSANLPKEIKSRFPEAGSFSKKNPTYEELRKMIILLYSYCFWYQVQHQKAEIDLDDYTSEMDAILAECGLSGLYMGNPFDWLFLYCTLEDYPLDTFRGLLYESLNVEE